MKQLHKLLTLLVTILPALIVLLLPQAPDHIEMLLAGILIIFSILLLYLCKKAVSPLWQKLGVYYQNGMIIALIALIICIFFPVGGLLCEPLYMAPSSENAQAIFVMASGATDAKDPNLSGYQRVLHGITLLKENRAPLLIISTGFSNDNGFAEAAWVASLTQLCAVPPEKMIIFKSERIRTSKSEADYAAEQLNRLNVNRILLVTNASHLYRGKLVFEKLGIEVLPAPCNSAEGIYHSMGHNLRSFDASVHEWLGLLYYRLRNYY